jgi:hypothetical protein
MLQHISPEQDAQNNANNCLIPQQPNTPTGLDLMSVRRTYVGMYIRYDHCVTPPSNTIRIQSSRGALKITRVTRWSTGVVFKACLCTRTINPRCNTTKVRVNPNRDQGCQMVPIFSNQNSNLGKFWRPLVCKIVVYFMTIWDRCYDFKIFSPKNSAKKLAFLTQNKAELCKNLIITLVFEKNANLFAENCQKSQKIVIITSVPGIFYCHLV